MRFSFVSSCFVLFCLVLVVSIHMCIYFIPSVFADWTQTFRNSTKFYKTMFTHWQCPVAPSVCRCYGSYFIVIVLLNFFLRSLFAAVACANRASRTQKHYKFVYLFGEEKYYVLIMRGPLSLTWWMIQFVESKHLTHSIQYNRFRLWSHHLWLPYNSSFNEMCHVILVE